MGRRAIVRLLVRMEMDVQKSKSALHLSRKNISMQIKGLFGDIALIAVAFSWCTGLMQDQGVQYISGKFHSVRDCGLSVADDAWLLRNSRNSVMLTSTLNMISLRIGCVARMCSTCNDREAQYTGPIMRYHGADI